jgi:glycosyltransferase involved in cell wall biosynthesis
MQALSVIIITFNEASQIARCIRSVQDIADEILVVDSYSTDNTIEIAQALGAKTLLHHWPGYAQQREWATAQTSHNLVLALDADEFLSPELSESIRKVKHQPSADTYSFSRFNKIGPYWVKYGSWNPDRKLRLFIKHKVQFIDNGGHDAIIPQPDTTHQQLSGKLLHFAYDNLHQRIAQINKLSSDSANYLFRIGRKSSWMHVLLKPTFRFLSEYILRLGCLDGFYGFAIAASSAQYVFWREYKLLELTRNPISSAPL